MEHIRQRIISICITHHYVTLDAEETDKLYLELQQYLKIGDPNLSEIDSISLTEMLFYLAVFMNQDIEADVIYRKLTDRFGNNSPKLHVMKATLIQITEGDAKAEGYLQRLINETLEFDTDSVDYLCASKKLLSIQRAHLPQETWLKRVLELVDKFPLDAELWWVLAMEYYAIGQFDEAAYCLEEVLVICPFSYHAFVQLGEVLYYKAVRSKKHASDILQEALDNSLRAVELSETFVKGWSFVAVISAKLNKQELLQLSSRKLKEVQATGNPQDKETAKVILAALPVTKAK